MFTPDEPRSVTHPHGFDESALLINSRLSELERREREEKEEQRQNDRKLVTFTRWLMIFTAVLAFATITTGGLIIWQNTVATRAAGAARESAREAKRSADTASQALAHSKEALEKTIQQNQESLKTTIAQQAAALRASTGLTRADQRPWLTASKFELSAELEEGKESPSVKVWFYNTGKTPALNEVSRIYWYVSGQEPELSYEFITPKKIDQRGSVTIIPPGAGIFTTESGRIVCPANGIAAYKDKKAYIYIHILMRYEDTYKTNYTTSVCVYHVSGMPLDSFTSCQRGTYMR